MKKLALLTPIMLVTVLVSGVWAASIYVSPTGTGDGSIGNPTNLQAALNTAKANTEDDTIYLQQGTYTAASTFLYDSTGTDTYAVMLLGGWNADFSSQTTDRTLTVLDGQNTRRVLKITGNGAGVNITFTIENLTIQNGRTNSYAAFPGETGYGAGISAFNTNNAQMKIIIRECLIRNNATTHSSSLGGGIYITCNYEIYGSAFSGNQTVYTGGAIVSSFFAPYTQSLAPIIDGCTFDSNTATNAGGSHIYNTVSPIIRNSSFYRSSGGGAINSVNNSFLTVFDCVFSGNVSNWWGGAIHIWDAGGDIRNCLFINNRSGASGDGAGGAVTMYDPSPASPRTVTITNCTFVGNMTGGYQASGGAIHNRVQTLSVTNSIFWNNGTTYGGTHYGSWYALANEAVGKGTVSYSDVQGGLGSTGFTDGGNNINSPPLFLGGDDYHLAMGSPGIDQGNNSAPNIPGTDFDGNDRIIDGNQDGNAVVDMGAYEYLPVIARKGTLGTQLTLTASGFGDKKGTVYVAYEQTPGVIKKMAAKVVTWTDGVITALWAKAMSVGKYDLFVQPKVPKGVLPISMDTFSIMNPEIGKIDPMGGVTGETVTIEGMFFSNKKPKILFEDPDTGKRKSSKVLSWTMDPVTGVGTVQFVVPKLEAKKYNLIVVTAIGEAKFEGY